jgi:DNA-directed RNA polymerase specialized sigma24 family protein
LATGVAAPSHPPYRRSVEPPFTERDAVLDALGGVTEALVHCRRLIDMIDARCAQITEARAAGARYTDIVRAADRPLVVELLTEHLRVLQRAGAELRRQEATMLRAEGMSVEQIASLFGVSHQRISTLLRGAQGRRS